MFPSSSKAVHDEEALSELAMRFRGTRVDEVRRDIAGEYSRVGSRLIAGGNWREMPGPEDQLPSEWMPDAFFQYWSNRLGVR